MSWIVAAMGILFYKLPPYSPCTCILQDKYFYTWYVIWAVGLFDGEMPLVWYQSPFWWSLYRTMLMIFDSIRVAVNVNRHWNDVRKMGSIQLFFDALYKHALWSGMLAADYGVFTSTLIIVITCTCNIHQTLSWSDDAPGGTSYLDDQSIW